MRQGKPSKWHRLAVACAASLASSCASVSEPAPPLPPVAPAATLESVPSPPDVTRPVASFAIAPPSAAPALELPRGGRTLFPDHRLVGFCGTPGAPALGPLLDHPATKTAKLLSLADRYASDRSTLPVFELIAVVVQAGGGVDGKNRVRVLDTTVDEYLQAARQARGLLLLNIQPGHSDFLTEVRRFERYLREPDVGVALDPEWAMGPKETPGKPNSTESTSWPGASVVAETTPQ